MQLYTFENRCYEAPELRLGDEAIKVFLNAKGTQGQISPELDMVLSYILRPKETPEQQSPLVKIISDEVNIVRISAKWRREYMAFDLLLREERTEAREEERAELILRMHAKGLTVEKIVDLTDYATEEVTRVIERGDH